MDLSSSQLKRLANRLEGTTNNIYLECEELFGHEVEDDLFERLEKECGIFRCDHCVEWMTIESRHPDGYSVCKECLDRQRG